MRESIVVAVLGVQLTIGGAVVFHAYELSGRPDKFGFPMIFFGVVFGVLASVRAYRSDKSTDRAGAVGVPFDAEATSKEADIALR